jgi:antitoxin YefM
MTSISYSDARKRLPSIWNEIESTHEEVILHRRGHEDMALLPSEELASLRETAYLLRSPRNAGRLLAALERSRAGEGEAFSSIEEVAEAAGLSSDGE